MKALAILILASLPTSNLSIPAVTDSQPQPHFSEHVQAAPKKTGKWYLAKSGHAVFCYGPVMTVSNGKGGVERVATFCRGSRLLVPLKD